MTIVTDPRALYESVCRHTRQAALLDCVVALLDWDEHTMMPEAAGDYRAEQTATVSRLAHERWIDRQFGQELAELAQGPMVADPDAAEAVNIVRLRRYQERRARLPANLVEELTRASVLGQQAWRDARRQNDFGVLCPQLERVFSLKREQADLLGFPHTRYDALLDDYEPETLTAEVSRVLAGLREELVPLVAAVRESRRRPDASILARTFPAAAQESFGRAAAQAIGFDFTRGRLDVTIHPFCTTLGPHDCRITTRYNERHFNEAFFGILHEAGHGIYEQGLPPEQFGLPLGQAASLGVHESQSRLWENMVGRSAAFWRHYFPEAQRHFPEALGDVSVEAFHFAVNEVRPSLVRIEADEVTYNLHILIRFELETALVAGDLAVADLPGAWAERYEKYLGIRPANDVEGVLQDIHWPSGLIGYFSTYTLGNLYAAQIMTQADADLGGLDDLLARGQFQPLRDWLRTQVHQHGQRYRGPQLVERITRRPLTHAPLIAYLRRKLAPLYGEL
jgi:carboxypeptidase Taq